MSRAVAIVALITLSGCGRPAAPRGATSASAQGKNEAQGARLIESTCTPCHDEERPDRPRFGGGAALTPALATQAAWLVAAGMMPPRKTLPSADRAQLIHAFCDAAALDLARCVGANDTSLRTPFVRHPEEYLRAAKAIAPPEPEPAPLAQRLRAHANGLGIVIRLDTSLALLLALGAAERCPPPKAGDDADFRRCVAALLDRGLVRVPAPEVQR